MDSVTQIVLGAAVGEATMANRAGRKAALWGAIFGTLPDLDVLIPMANEVASYTYHRGFSHSLLVATAVSPLLGWVIHRIPGHRTAGLSRWILLVWMVLVTHMLLDALTTYGTQLLWPLPNAPVAWNAIFIIDPLYTVPLAIGLSICLFRRSSQQPNHVGLAVSTLYLGMAFVAKAHVATIVEAQIDQGSAERYMTSPMPFNTLLWRVLIQDDFGYREGFVSVFDSKDTLRTRSHSWTAKPTPELGELWAYQRLSWFTRGYMRLDKRDGVYRVTDLRMGQDDRYLFAFDIARESPEGLMPVLSTAAATPEFEIPEGYFSALLQRIMRACPNSMPEAWRQPPVANLFSCMPG